MDTRTAQRPDGSHADTTFYEHRVPSAQRRRIEAPLFREPNLRYYEEDMLLPALRSRLDAARRQHSGDGRVPLDLRGLMRSCLSRVSAVFAGLDDVDDSVFDEYLGLIEGLGIRASVEWLVSDHRETLRLALVQGRVHGAVFPALVGAACGPGGAIRVRRARRKRPAAVRQRSPPAGPADSLFHPAGNARHGLSPAGWMCQPGIA